MNLGSPCYRQVSSASRHHPGPHFVDFLSSHPSTVPDSPQGDSGGSFLQLSTEGELSVKHVCRPWIWLAALAASITTAMTLFVDPSPALTGREVRCAAKAIVIKDCHIVVDTDVIVPGRCDDELTPSQVVKYVGERDCAYRRAVHECAGALGEAAAWEPAAELAACVQQRGRVHKTGTQPSPPSWVRPPTPPGGTRLQFRQHQSAQAVSSSTSALFGPTSAVPIRPPRRPTCPRPSPTIPCYRV